MKATLLFKLFNYLKASWEGPDNKPSHKKLSVLYLYLLLTYMIVTTSPNYPTEVWYLVSGGAIGTSGITAYQRIKEGSNTRPIS